MSDVYRWVERAKLQSVGSLSAAIVQGRGPNLLRILIADDNQFMRNGLSFLLKSRAGWVVCGEAIDGREAVEKAFQLKPDVILLDVSMPHLNGFEAARRIHEQLPDSEILVVTEHDPRVVASLAPQPGVRGYVVKSRIGLDLISAVDAASKHQPVPAAA